MIQEFDVKPVNGVDFAGLVSDWQEYSEMQRFSDYEQFFGAEVAVPVHYEPR